MGIRPVNIMMAIINSQHSKSLEPDQHIKNIQQSHAISEQNHRVNESVSRISDSENDTEQMEMIKHGDSEGQSHFDTSSFDQKKDAKNQDLMNNNIEDGVGESIDILS